MKKQVLIITLLTISSLSSLFSLSTRAATTLLSEDDLKTLEELSANDMPQDQRNGKDAPKVDIEDQFDFSLNRQLLEKGGIQVYSQKIQKSSVDDKSYYDLIKLFPSFKKTLNSKGNFLSVLKSVYIIPGIEAKDLSLKTLTNEKYVEKTNFETQCVNVNQEEGTICTLKKIPVLPDARTEFKITVAHQEEALKKFTPPMTQMKIHPNGLNIYDLEKTNYSVYVESSSVSLVYNLKDASGVLVITLTLAGLDTTAIPFLLRPVVKKAEECSAEKRLRTETGHMVRNNRRWFTEQ